MDDIPENRTGWYNLPREMREHVIKQMDSETKLEFFTSNPQFLLDIPKTYVKGIEFRANQLKVQSFDNSSFIIDFNWFRGNAEVSVIRNGKVTWRRIEMFAFSVKLAISIYFKRIVRNAINLERIIIFSWNFPFDTTTIKHLEKIRSLMIRQETPVDLYEHEFMSPDQFPDHTMFMPLNLRTMDKLKETFVRVDYVDRVRTYLRQHPALNLND